MGKKGKTREKDENSRSKVLSRSGGPAIGLGPPSSRIRELGKDIDKAQSKGKDKGSVRKKSR
jgi:hypothetical protein